MRGMRKAFNYLFVLLLVLPFSTCTEEQLEPSIFDTTEKELDPDSDSYFLDLFLEKNYLEPYNLQFRYKMQDVGADMNYNLVPATYENAKKMAVLTKYLWFDAYGEVLGVDFLKEWGPRIIHLIGSPAYNPANHTMILGLAEGGIKVSLFRVNSLDPASVEQMNEYYFKTMHHEFAHILHQTKTYPKEFNLISSRYYEPFSWQDRNDNVAASLGFVSSYGSSQTREDFVEVIANYIVKSDADWNSLLDIASKGWKVEKDSNGKEHAVEMEDADGVDGKAVILQKLQLCKTWLADVWGVDLDALRGEVQYRQNNLDIDVLLSQIGD